jgi:hypothetical protein
MKRISLAAGILALTMTTSRLLAWDYEGHRLVNQLALASLPTNFPSFVRVADASERVAFLAGEPDRWRNTPDLPLQHCQEPEHFMDLELLAGFDMKPDSLPPFRYDFISALGAFRSAHPDKAADEDSAPDPAHKYRWVGLLPWAITENYSKLKSGFSYLKTFETGGGTPDEIANAQANILYIMGTMGHYVGDASQPLHTTIHHHGWKGENPHDYSTRSGIHSFIDGYFKQTSAATFKSLSAKLRPAQIVSIEGRSAKPEEMFQAFMLFIMDNHKLVEPLYKLDKEGKLSTDGDASEGRAFLEAQILKSGQLLGDIWYSAWQQAPPDTFLQRSLAGRKKPAAAENEKK